MCVNLTKDKIMKKLLTVLLSLVTATACALGFTACNGNASSGGNDSDGKVEGSAGLEYTLSEDETYYCLTGVGTCTDTEITIGNYYNGKPIKQIGKYAYTKIEEIEEIANSELIEFGDNDWDSLCIFADSNVKSITIAEGITAIGVYTFAGHLGDGANFGRNPIRKIILPYSLKTIGYGAFMFCGGGVSDSSITIPAGVTEVGEFAFGLSKYKEIILPDGLTAIGAYMFADSFVERVTVPSGVVRIGESAFSGCEYLKSIVFKGTKEQWTAIEKDEEWYPTSGEYTVHCTDGDITESFSN